MRYRSLPHLAGLVAGGLLVLSACGGSSGSATAPVPTTASAGSTAPAAPTDASAPSTAADGSAAAAPPAAAPSTAAAAPSPLPDVTVIDAATGAPVELARLLPADKPLLLWFWAPH